MAITQFFEAIYIGILKRLFITGFTKSDLFKLVSTYFGIIKLNGQGILYLHFFI